MTSFLSSCGVTDSLQLVVRTQGSDEGGLRLLRQPFAVIGRAPEADLVLDDEQVSRRHVYLQVVEGWAFWIDLESRTGTYSDRDIQKFGWLEGERVLRIGPYLLQRYAGDNRTVDGSARGKPPRDTPLVALAYSHTLLPQITLQFLNGPSRSMSWPMHRVMSLIGSASGCKFRLTDPSVSRFHASLLRTSTGLWIVDLLGQGGVTVNEMAMRFGRLDDGDVLGIGRYRIRVWYRYGGQEAANGSCAETRLAKLQRRDPESDGLKLPERAAAGLKFEPGLGGAKGAELPIPIQRVFPSLNFDAVPSATTLSGPLTQSELIESVLVPLVNQFGLMQQQMFEQFQQVMGMMAQMFGTMHRDQMEGIRAELNQLRELAEEFQALKSELADLTQDQSQTMLCKPVGNLTRPNRSAAAEPGVSVAAVVDRVSGSRARAQVANDASNSPGTAQIGQEVLSPLAESGALERQPSADCAPCQSPNSPSPTSRTTPPTSKQFQPIGSPSQAASTGASLTADSDRDTIVWLHQRIMTLQRQRESHWQKLLKLLPGVS